MDSRELWKISERLKLVEESIAEMRNIINQYFTQEEQTILMYEASIGREETVLGKFDEEEMKAYALACQNYLKFGREVDACMAGDLDRRTAVCLGHIPDVLEKTGCRKTDMYITQKHLRNILHDSSVATSHYHSIDIRQLKQLPELLQHPLAVLANEKNPDTIVVILDAKDRDENQLIVPINRNGHARYQGKQVEANFILSVYGKRNITHYLEKNAAIGSVLFLDKKNKYQIRKGAAPIAAGPKV